MNANTPPGGCNRPEAFRESTFFKKPEAAAPAPAAPSPPAPASPTEPVSEASQHQLKKRKSINKFAARLVAGLVFTTALIIAVNWYGLHYRRQLGLPTFYVAYASSKPTPTDYRAELRWQQKPAQASSPILARLYGQALPCTLQIPPTQGRIQKFKLEFEIPPGSPAGRFEGNLVLQPLNVAAAGDPGLVTYPVALNVEGFWQQWQPSLWYGGIVLALYALLYIGFTLFSPTPKGKALIRLSEGDSNLEVALRRQPLSWLCPWLRSVLPLAWVSRQAGGIGLLEGYSGNLSFDYAVCLELESVGDTVRYGAWRPHRRPKPDDGVKCPSLVQLHPGRAVVFWDHEKRGSASLTYLPGG